MDDRRLLPLIHQRRVPDTPSMYYEDDYGNVYHKRKRYLDAGYLQPHPHHHSHYATDPLLYASPKVYPRRYYDDYVTTTRRSLPAYRPVPAYDYRDRWLDKHTTCAHCRTLPRISSKLVPSMHYDELRCPHCEDKMKKRLAEEKVMTYPWTAPASDTDSQTMVLQRVDEEGPHHDTVSAPAQLVGGRPSAMDGQPALNTAPTHIYLKGKEKRRLLAEDEGRQALHHHHHRQHRPSPHVARDELTLVNEISPDDSISNCGMRPFRSIMYDRERPKHSAYSEPYFQSVPRRVDDSPRPLRHVPRRQFDGHYVDVRNGKKYKYKVNYLQDGHVDSERRRLRSH